VIDTHCHLLWRVDDGPRSPMDSIDLARVLVGQGIRASLCTPHYSTRFPTRADVARARFDELQRDLRELDVPLQTQLAAEVHFRLALSVPVEELHERSAGGFVVVELDGEADAATVTGVLNRLRPAGLLPVLAHPERARALREDPGPLEEARAEGALVQVVASSLMRRRGRASADGAWALLDGGHADLLASDAHGAAGTAGRIRELLDVATQRYGAKAVDALTSENPARLLDLERV